MSVDQTRALVGNGHARALIAATDDGHIVEIARAGDGLVATPVAPQIAARFRALGERRGHFELDEIDGDWLGVLVPALPETSVEHPFEDAELFEGFAVLVALEVVLGEVDDLREAIASDGVEESEQLTFLGEFAEILREARDLRTPVTLFAPS